MKPSTNTPKISRLADAVRLAMRAYENGKQDTSLKLIELVASQLETSEERKVLHRQVEAEVKRSQVWSQYYTILFRGGLAQPTSGAVAPQEDVTPAADNDEETGNLGTQSPRLWRRWLWPWARRGLVAAGPRRSRLLP